MEKTLNNRAWFLVLPMLVIVAFSAVIPLMTVVNYALNDTFGNNQFFWAGLDWFDEMLHSDRLWSALGRQILFSAIILAIEVPLGILRRAQHAEEGLLGLASASSSWRCRCSSPSTSSARSGRSSGAPTSAFSAAPSTRSGIDYNYTNDPIDAWITIVVMDVWHWTSLVALLCYAALQSIPRGLLPGGAHRPGAAAGASSATSSCLR